MGGQGRHTWSSVWQAGEIEASKQSIQYTRWQENAAQRSIRGHYSFRCPNHSHRSARLKSCALPVPAVPAVQHTPPAAPARGWLAGSSWLAVSAWLAVASWLPVSAGRVRSTGRQICQPGRFTPRSSAFSILVCTRTQDSIPSAATIHIGSPIILSAQQE